MKDVQNSIDQRGIAIQRVGIKDAYLPFLIKTKSEGYQQVTAKVCFTVALPMEYKGTHMSRFLEILNPWSTKPVAEPEMAEILSEASRHLPCKEAIHIQHRKTAANRSLTLHKVFEINSNSCFFGLQPV